MELQKHAIKFMQDWQAQEKENIKIALFGQPGAGKSSLINELVGKKVAVVSNRTDTTKQVQVIEHNDVFFVDLPGYGTSRFPVNAYFSKFTPLDYDLFLCVFSGKLHKEDIEFFKFLEQHNRRCVFVRNKADGIYDENMSLAESKKLITSEVSSQLNDDIEVFFTSCRKDISLAKKGILELQEEIIKQIDPAKEDKFIRSAASYSEEFLNKKKKLCYNHLQKAMLQAAANGLNPIFGVDIGIDAKIMSVMYKNIRETFGITDEELENNTFDERVIQLINMGLKKENIIKAIKKLATDNFVQKSGKYIPVIGQVLSMSLSAGSMYYLGLEYVDACYDLAKYKLSNELKR